MCMREREGVCVYVDFFFFGGGGGGGVRCFNNYICLAPSVFY